MAQRSGYDGVFISSEDGKPMDGVVWTVYNASGNLATIYETKSGSALMPNSGSNTTTDNGLVRFWAAPGYYEIEVEDSEVPARFTERRIPWSAVAGDDDGISIEQIDISNTINQSMIMDEAVGKAELKIYAENFSNATNANHTGTIVSATNIPAGVYQVTTVAALSGGGKPGFEVTSGTGTFKQTTPGSGTNPSGFTTMCGILTCTTTCSIRLYGTTLNSPATNSMTVFGVKN
jgi:hypothetical protein